MHVRMNTQSIKKEKKFLSTIATSWFATAVIGQWIFGSYVILFYGTAIITGQPELWNKVLPHGYVPGDSTGNYVVGGHLLITAITIFGGPLQLMPATVKYWPGFHRWNGRLYIIAALVGAITGLYMVWVRGSIGGIVQHTSISINALLIIVFAVAAYRKARARDFKNHRIWAIRLFLAMSGVWFFRIGFNCWLIVNQGPAGFDPKTFTGPALFILSFSQYLVPLIIFELYRKAQAGSGKLFKRAVASAIILFILVMVVGIIGATKDVWLPRIAESLRAW